MGVLDISYLKASGLDCMVYEVDDRHCTIGTGMIEQHELN